MSLELFTTRESGSELAAALAKLLRSDKGTYKKVASALEQLKEMDRSALLRKERIKSLGEGLWELRPSKSKQRILFSYHKKGVVLLRFVPQHDGPIPAKDKATALQRLRDAQEGTLSDFRP